MTDKRALRAHFLYLREKAKSAEKDEAITENLMRSPYFAAERFFVYCSVRSEVATDKLIAALLAAGKQVCVPRIEGGVMLAVPYAKLERGAFGIPAPRGGEDTVCDVALTPLLAADCTDWRTKPSSRSRSRTRHGICRCRPSSRKRERIAFRCLTALPRTRYNIDNIRTAARTAGKRSQNAAPFRKALFCAALCIYGNVCRLAQTARRTMCPDGRKSER